MSDISWRVGPVQHIYWVIIHINYTYQLRTNYMEPYCTLAAYIIDLSVPVWTQCSCRMTLATTIHIMADN